MKKLRSLSTPPHQIVDNKGRSTRQKALLAVLIISVLFNILVILPYVQPYYTRFQKKFFPKEHFTNATPDKEVLDKVCEATIELKGVKMSMNEPKGLLEDLIAFFKPKRNSSIFNNHYTAYAMVGVSYYAIAHNDSTMMNKLRKKADKFIDLEKHSLTYPIVVIDQASIGELLLNFYKWYKDDAYLNVATSLYNKVKDMSDKQGRILYRQGKVDLVDALGMYVPFLMEYFSLTNDSTALRIVNSNMERYKEYAVNPKTGIPAHGYDLRSGIPVGSASWGRGIGWYVLAAAYCPQIQDAVLDSTLAKIDYTQFPGNSEHFDSSTALMIEIYKQSKDKTRKLSLDFIKSHVLTNGMVDDCSGDTYGLNSHSKTFGESELCNGFLLMLASKFSNS